MTYYATYICGKCLAPYGVAVSAAEHWQVGFCEVCGEWRPTIKPARPIPIPGSRGVTQLDDLVRDVLGIVDTSALRKGHTRLLVAHDHVQALKHGGGFATPRLSADQHPGKARE